MLDRVAIIVHVPPIRRLGGSLPAGRGWKERPHWQPKPTSSPQIAGVQLDDQGLVEELCSKSGVLRATYSYKQISYLEVQLADSGDYRSLGAFTA